MLMILMAVLGVIEIGRAIYGYLFDSVNTLDTLVIGILCLAVAEVIRRHGSTAPDEEKAVVPNRSHPLG
jgi:hypothetical protein